MAGKSCPVCKRTGAEVNLATDDEGHTKAAYEIRCSFCGHFILTDQAKIELEKHENQNLRECLSKRIHEMEGKGSLLEVKEKLLKSLIDLCKGLSV